MRGSALAFGIGSLLSSFSWADMTCDAKGCIGVPNHLRVVPLTGQVYDYPFAGAAIIGGGAAGPF